MMDLTVSMACNIDLICCDGIKLCTTKETRVGLVPEWGEHITNDVQHVYILSSLSTFGSVIETPRDFYFSAKRRITPTQLTERPALDLLSTPNARGLPCAMLGS